MLGAAYIFYRRALRRPVPFSMPAVVLIAAIAAIAAWSAPALFSSDVYAYAAYGELARTGLNPYSVAPPNAADPVVRAAQVQWVTAFPICVYGPVFVAIASAIVSLFAPFGPLAQLDAFRLLASAALLLCVPLATVAYRGARLTRLRAAAAIALNPTAVWCAAEGHNDALALAVVLAGFALVRARRELAGGALVALAALVKPFGIAAALGLAIAQRRARLGAISGAALSCVLCIPLLAGIASQVAPHGHYAPQASLQAVFAPLGSFAAIAFAAAAAVAIAIHGIALLRRSRTEGWIWLGLAVWAAIPNPYPWYSLWLVALAAIAPQSRAANVAMLLSLTSLARYAPDAVGPLGGWAAEAIAVAASLPLLGLARTEKLAVAPSAIMNRLHERR